MSSTPDIGQRGDNIIKSKGSDRVDRFDMTGVNQDKELIKETALEVSFT